jgi:predicted transcriptional regulator
VAAALLAFAALHDERDGPVQDEEISRVLGNAASTVRRHLKEHHTIARHVGKGWFAPVD